ncbi:uncharacterized protein A1O5_08853 [Cladophialophora psammophila CBS 110553]|uniref:CAP-Gly domain-containing protein n=1 Tax=Cladophialophora psammophila CBS 110553 TaxID=1182543 RepID=W9WJY4_9EURO|nr:uncharacterized protein A1O5_08853 [Cladophialophora psammophila CBS 110553]EXJ68238.1 hypothetical protein A1O5_08853 [Cladophialophora psammophila CBS 110553]
MASGEVYVGQRRSYAGALCSVRYHGPLSNTKGEWLGVEWDDPSRGKHNGQHEGQQIFQCLSSSPTAASFVRPSRNPDLERTLLEAIKFKYAPISSSGVNVAVSSAADDMIEISGKVVEEVGFERIQKQLSVLTDLKIVLVDELVVSGIARRGASRQHIRNAQLEVERTCPNIVELDLGWNVIETWRDIVDMCIPFRKLKILKAGGLRLRDFEVDYSQEACPFQDVEELHLNECLLTPEQILNIFFSKGQCGFPSLKTISLSLNELGSFEIDGATVASQCPALTTLILDNNRFADLSSLPVLFSLFPNIKTLSFQGNTISNLGLDSCSSSTSSSISNLETLNLANNQIRDYSFVTSLPDLFPNLTSLRISRNPLYEQSTTSDEAQSTTSDSTSYYLTLARIPHLKSLNYTTITPRDREEGEIYYLSVGEKELRSLLQRNTARQPLDQASEAQSSLSQQETIALARKSHPLYSSLCQKYDREDILCLYLQQQSSANRSSNVSQEKSDFENYAPGTLGSRLVDACFYIPLGHASTTTMVEPFQRLLPTTISVYRLKSLLSRHFSLPPLRFRLVYESHEYDPVEPISSTRNPTAGTGEAKDAWDAWGEWDVDEDKNEAGDTDGSGSDRSTNSEGEGDCQGDGGRGDPSQGKHLSHLSPVDHGNLLDGNTQPTMVSMPMYITREGHRFKKRETEVLDGMRPWGDFLDLDTGHGHSHSLSHDLDLQGAHAGHWSSGRRGKREVKVRVEPHDTI